MGVTADADKLRDTIKESLDEAYSGILQFLDGSVWGSEDYNEEYIDGLGEILLDLRKIRKKI